MGEIADMMLEGVLCEGCGEYLESDGDGIPDYCSPECAEDRGADWWLEANDWIKVNDESVQKGGDKNE